MYSNRPHILVIDDTLDIDFKRQKLGDLEHMFGDRENAPVVAHVPDQASALRKLKNWKEWENIQATAVICDYKLEGESGRDEWGRA